MDCDQMQWLQWDNMAQDTQDGWKQPATTATPFPCDQLKTDATDVKQWKGKLQNITRRLQNKMMDMLARMSEQGDLAAMLRRELRHLPEGHLTFCDAEGNTRQATTDAECMEGTRQHHG
jgi:hypothetical protein